MLLYFNFIIILRSNGVSLSMREGKGEREEEEKRRATEIFQQIGSRSCRRWAEIYRLSQQAEDSSMS